MSDIFVGLFFGIFIGSILTIILGIIVKDTEETKQSNEELDTKETTIFTSAEQLSDVSNKGEQKLKDNTINELFTDMEYVAANGDYTWYGHDNDGIHRDVLKRFTQREITEILEPLGYQVKFNPMSQDADILMIRWGKDIVENSRWD